MNIAIVPYKGGSQAKTRLSSVLGSAGRDQLSRRMLDHVLEQLRRAPHIDSILVVTSATIPGCNVVPDPDSGLNAAVKAGLDAGLKQRANTLIVLPADLPSLTSADISAALSALTDSVSGVVAPSKDGGTGGLILRRSRIIGPEFGPNSGRLHAAALAATGQEPAIIHRSGLALDLDEPEDLDLFGDHLLDIVWNRDASNLHRPIQRTEEAGQHPTRTNFEE